VQDDRIVIAVACALAIGRNYEAIEHLPAGARKALGSTQGA
jgi:hypothetical protein